MSQEPSSPSRASSPSPPSPKGDDPPSERYLEAARGYHQNSVAMLQMFARNRLIPIREGLDISTMSKAQLIDALTLHEISFPYANPAAEIVHVNPVDAMNSRIAGLEQKFDRLIAMFETSTAVPANTGPTRGNISHADANNGRGDFFHANIGRGDSSHADANNGRGDFFHANIGRGDSSHADANTGPTRGTSSQADVKFSPYQEHDPRRGPGPCGPRHSVEDKDLTVVLSQLEMFPPAQYDGNEGVSKLKLSFSEVTRIPENWRRIPLKDFIKLVKQIVNYLRQHAVKYDVWHSVLNLLMPLNVQSVEHRIKEAPSGVG